MTGLVLLFARWVIRRAPPCILVAVMVRLASPFVAELKAIRPEGFLSARARPPHVDLDREIQRLLDGGR